MQRSHRLATIAVAASLLMSGCCGLCKVKTPKPAAAPQTQRLVRGSDEIILAYSPISDVGQLYIDQFKQGQPVGSLHIHRQGGMTVGADRDGHVVLTAQTLASGGILIRDGSGKQMVSYSSDQVDRLLGASQ